MRVKRTDLLLIVAAVVLCVGTCVVAKLTTPPFEPTEVTYQPATTTATTTASTAAAKTALRLDLNTASKDDLLKVEGIGEVMADRILAYREQNGGFDTVEELLQVAGVGEKRLEKWRDIFYIAAE